MTERVDIVLPSYLVIKTNFLLFSNYTIHLFIPIRTLTVTQTELISPNSYPLQNIENFLLSLTENGNKQINLFQVMKLTQLDFHKTLTNLFLIFLLCLNRRQESLLCKRLRFSIPLKRLSMLNYYIETLQCLK